MKEWFWVFDVQYKCIEKMDRWEGKIVNLAEGLKGGAEKILHHAPVKYSTILITCLTSGDREIIEIRWCGAPQHVSFYILLL